ncbi:MAG: O-antigen ligase family protein, partial [bacterium]
MERAFKFFDIATLFFICALIFFLPISKAAIQITVSLSILAFLGASITKKFKNFPKTDLNIQLFVFIVALLLSVLFSVDLKTSSITFLKKNLEWFLLFFIIIATLKSSKRIKIFLGVFFFSAFIVVLDGLIQQINGADLFRGHIYNDRISASFDHHNNLAGYIGVMLPVTFSFFIITKKKIINIFFFVLTLLLMYCLMMTFSRGGYLSTFIAFDFFLIFSLFKFKNLNFRKLSISLLIFINIIILFSIISAYRLPIDLVVERLRVEGGAGRFLGGIWSQTFTLFKSKPFFGYGPGTFMETFKNFNCSLKPTYTHNCYLQMLMEIGLIGFIPFLWIIIISIKILIKSILKNNN